VRFSPAPETTGQIFAYSALPHASHPPFSSTKIKLYVQLTIATAGKGLLGHFHQKIHTSIILSNFQCFFRHFFMQAQGFKPAANVVKYSPFSVLRTRGYRLGQTLVEMQR